MKVLFLYLKAFSLTGGIEKFNRSFLKALADLEEEKFIKATAISAYDTSVDEKYFPSSQFKGYNGNKLLFTLNCLVEAYKYDTVIISHINLALVGYLMKKMNPSLKLALIAHGIEIWPRQSGVKRKILDQASLILAVSQFTKNKIVELNKGIAADKISVFPNTMDPYVDLPTDFSKPEYLIDRYNLRKESIVLLTITRLSSSEKYKGYDDLIEAMPELLKLERNFQYLICGKADDLEKKRIEDLIDKVGVKDSVRLIGFVAESELRDHYLLADIFIMKSKMEGFGIVFIEALANGRKVIAGNKDGSVDALMNGELGWLIDPDSEQELIQAVKEALTSKHNPVHVQEKVMKAFGFPSYKLRLRNFLNVLRAT
ncbi:hypothetical protein BH09BAC3_BH09BAC3_12990 [soil metagenome]